jgi:hypothetical protein
MRHAMDKSRRDVRRDVVRGVTLRLLFWNRRGPDRACANLHRPSVGHRVGDFGHGKGRSGRSGVAWARYDARQPDDVRGRAVE